MKNKIILIILGIVILTCFFFLGYFTKETLDDPERETDGLWIKNVNRTQAEKIAEDYDKYGT